MRLRTDVVLSPVNTELRNAVADDGWFKNEETNWVLGFGRGLIGTALFTEAFKGFIKKDGEKFSLQGIYRGDTPIGFCCITFLPGETRTAEILMFLAPEYRGKFGLAATAMTKVLHQVFSNKSVFRVQIDLLSINKKAISFLRKFGFTQEGIRKSAFWMGVNGFNIVTLRILRPEWRRLEE